MPVPALGTTLQGVGTTATAASLSITPVPGGGFQADQHRILLTGGIVNPVNVPLAGTIIDGSGTGTLTSTRNGNQFDIFFSMNIDDSEPLSGGNLAIQGVVVGRGSVTAIPEPTSIFALTSLAAVVCIRRRR